MIQQKQSNEYDVILLGSGVGSLVAGTLLSRGKLSVLLLKEKGYEASFTKEGYRFIPFSNGSEKIIRAPSAKRLFQMLTLSSLGSSKTDHPSWGQEVPFQIILPEARIDLFCDRAQMSSEWRREIPEELPRVEQFYREMAYERSRLRREESREGSLPFFPLRPPSMLHRLLPSEPPLGLSLFTKEFRAFVHLQLMAWGSLRPDRFATSLAAYLLSFDEAKEWVSDVDLEEMKGKLLTDYLRSGGRVEEIETVERIYKGWMKGVAILLSGNGKILRSKFLVLNAPLHRIVNLPGRKGKRLSRWAQRVRPKDVLFPFFLGIQEKVVPVGMRDFVISLRDYEKPYEDGNLLFLALSPKGDEGRAPKGKRALTVESLVPWETYTERWDEASASEHRAGVMQHVRHLIPFLEDHIEFMDCDQGNQLIRHWSYPHFHYESTAPFVWREGLIPTRLSRNVYLAGNQNSPYLGLEGEALTGWMVAKQILRRK